MNEGIIGVIYLAASVAYGVGTLFAGQLTDKLVRFPQVVHTREKSAHTYKSSLKTKLAGKLSACRLAYTACLGYKCLV